MTDSKSKSESKSEKDPEKGAEKASDQVQEVVDEETEQGYRGTEVDPTPNHAYTVDGVTSGEPTPETDPDHAEKVASKATTKFNNKF